MNLKLAQIAVQEAKKNYHGNTAAAIGNLQPIAQLFRGEPDVNEQSLDGNWSGAFVYWCAKLAGVGLPTRYPDPRIGKSFAEAIAWERYARLPKIHLWHEPGEDPEVGDLVVIEPKGKNPMKVGVILAVTPDVLETAEGDYHNHSALVERQRDEYIRGYIRLNG
ncbi:MAG: hypothetical protein IJW16_06815 [Clostridia bacterium]|nr:hypothetical protein [Clostridia bacterium]